MKSRATQFVESHESSKHARVEENLILLILEKTLYADGTYHKVVEEIGRQYGCSLLDCCRKPEYFCTALKDQNPESYTHTIRVISRQLEIFSGDEVIAMFLKALNAKV